jgi:sensor histidine kinase regulating citrate/malate metabolism
MIPKRYSSVEMFHSGNAAVDGILYHYSQRADADGIKLKIAGTVKSNGIPDDELSVLLGNAMENAFAGCKTVEQDRYVTFVSQSEPQVLSLMIQNSFDGKLKIKQGELHSRKRAHGPGIGISSMKMICEKYGGTMEMQWDDHSFTVLIVLPVEI